MDLRELLERVGFSSDRAHCGRLPRKCEPDWLGEKALLAFRVQPVGSTGSGDISLAGVSLLGRRTRRSCAARVHRIWTLRD